MILSDNTIMKMLNEGELTITPLDQKQIQPASVDIRLGNTFSVVEDTSSGIITLDNIINYKTIQTDTYLILPGQFVLATTMEYFELPDNLTAFVEGRSSLGRMGLFIQNAGWVDPGFKGEITLELYNANRCAIELKSGRRIGQLVFAKMDDSALNPYNGKYQGQTGATGSRIFMDNDRSRLKEVKFYDKAEDQLLKFAVIIARTNDKWVFCKHRERDTYEVPGGHRESGEDILTTARRELREETGAVDFTIKPICVYSVKGKTKINENIDDETFGMLFIADIFSFEEIHSEIESILITDHLVDNWTYPQIQPKLLEEAKNRGYL